MNLVVLGAEVGELLFEVCTPVLEPVSFSDEVDLIELQIFFELGDADTQLLPLCPSGRDLVLQFNL